MARVTRTERYGHWRSGRIRPVGDHCSFDSFKYEDTRYDLSAL